jgi:hypothetical protein
MTFIDTRSAQVTWRVVNTNSIASLPMLETWSLADHNTNDKCRAIYEICHACVQFKVLAIPDRGLRWV